jgi:hypothetical protein
MRLKPYLMRGKKLTSYLIAKDGGPFLFYANFYFSKSIVICVSASTGIPFSI